MTHFRENDHQWIRETRFQDISASELLEKGASTVEPTGAKPRAWVFDLDSTLFCTSGRNKRVFEAYLSKQDGYPEHWGMLLSELSPSVQEYGIPKTFCKILISKGWEKEDAIAEAKTLWAQYQDHWMKEFFAGENMALDEAYQGASDFVGKVQRAGREVVYLTGRDSPRALDGTLEALKKSGFPVGKGTHLRLKPSSEMGDAEFKDLACSSLAEEFEVEVFLDNEPENLEIFAKRFPEALIVFYHSIMSPRSPSSDLGEHLGDRNILRLLDYT